MAKVEDLDATTSLGTSSYFYVVADGVGRKISYAELVEQTSQDISLPLTNLTETAGLANENYFYVVSAGFPQKVRFDTLKGQVLAGFAPNLDSLDGLGAIPDDANFYVSYGGEPFKSTFEQIKNKVIEDTFLDVPNLTAITSLGNASLFPVYDATNAYSLTFSALKTNLLADLVFDVSSFPANTSLGSGDLFFVKNGPTDTKVTYNTIKNAILAEAVVSIYSPFSYYTTTSAEARYNEDASWVTLVSVPVTGGRLQETRGVKLDFGGKFKVRSGSAVTKTLVQIIHDSTTVFDGYTYGGRDPSLLNNDESVFGSWFVQNTTSVSQVHSGFISFGTKDNLADTFNTYSPVTLMDTTAPVSGTLVSVGNHPYRSDFRISFIGQLDTGDQARFKVSPDGTVWTFKDYATVGFYDEIQGPFKYIKVNKSGSSGYGKIVGMMPKAERSEIRITDSTPFHKTRTAVSTGDTKALKIRARLSANTSVRSSLCINYVRAVEVY